MEKNVKDSLAIVVSEMYERDQKYRKFMLWRTTDTLKIDSIQSLSFKKRYKIITSQTSLPQATMDSLWNLQSINDSLNFEHLVSLLKEYGFLSKKRIGVGYLNTIILHMMHDDEFCILDTLLIQEVEKGNLSPKSYASWYDRYLLITGQAQLYGEYNTYTPCVTSLEETNRAREKIGLKKLKKNICP
ncbi:MAG: hypothetical protein MK078_03915 [Crocinitomicaceae bacterium]|nr:hypothetical protein [Crocinitomicaceae bacterium]